MRDVPVAGAKATRFYKFMYIYGEDEALFRLRVDMPYVIRPMTTMNSIGMRS